MAITIWKVFNTTAFMTREKYNVPKITVKEKIHYDETKILKHYSNSDSSHVPDQACLPIGLEEGDDDGDSEGRERNRLEEDGDILLGPDFEPLLASEWESSNGGRGGIRQEEEIDREDAASDFFLRMKAGVDLPPVSDERLVMGRKGQRKPSRRRRRSKGRERNYEIEPRREGRVPEGRATRQSDVVKGDGRCGRQPVEDLPMREEKLDNLRCREGDAGWMPIGHGQREKCNCLALLGWKTCFRSERWKGRKRRKESRRRGKQSGDGGDREGRERRWERESSMRAGRERLDDF
ncbi:hypothetical protein ACLOJK_040493 [Asimina triloba]